MLIANPTKHEERNKKNVITLGDTLSKSLAEDFVISRKAVFLLNTLLDNILAYFHLLYPKIIYPNFSQILLGR